VTSLSPLVPSRADNALRVAARATEILPKLAENHLQAQAVIPSISLWFLSDFCLEFGFNSRRQLKGYVFLLQCKSGRLKQFSSFCFANREAKRAICITIVYISKFPTLKKVIYFSSRVNLFYVSTF